MFRLHVTMYLYSELISCFQRYVAGRTEFESSYFQTSLLRVKYWLKSKLNIE